MSTVEKLFAQIFEHNNWIIEQAKQQTLLYNQHLASKLLVDGIIPPTWLWNPTSSSDSNSKELNKEELISKLLDPQPSVHYRGRSYHKTAIRENNQEFYDGIFMGTGNASPNRHADLSVPATSSSGHAGHALNCVPELDRSIMSPGGQADESFLNFHNAPDHSLARIQRSKSRQKALELRSSAKALGKGALVHGDIGEILSSGIRLSISSTKQADRKDELANSEKPHALCSQGKEDSDLDEANCLNKDNNMDIDTGRMTRSRSHLKVPGVGRTYSELKHTQDSKKDDSSYRDKTNKWGFMCISDSEPVGQYNNLLKSAGPSSVFGQNDADMKLDDSDCHSKDKEVAVSACKITWSKNYVKHQSCEHDSWKVDSSCIDNQRMNNSVMNSVDNLRTDHVEGSVVKTTPCYAHNEDMEAQGSILQDYKSYRDKSIVVSHGRMTRSGSSSQCRDCVDDTSDLGLNSHPINTNMGIHPSVSRRSVLQSTVPNEELGFLKSSMELIHRVTRSQPICHDLEISKPLNYSQTSSRHDTDSRSSLTKESFASEDQIVSGCKIIPPCYETHGTTGELGSAALCMASESQLCCHIDQSVCLSSDVAEQRRKLASLVALPDACAFVEPKQLDFNAVKECNTKNLTSSTPSSANHRSNSLPETLINNAENLEEEIPDVASNLSLEKQSPEKSEFSDKGKEVDRNSFECDVREYLDTCAENHASVESECKMSNCSQDNMQSGTICKTYEVQDLVITPSLRFDQVKHCLEQGHGSWAGKHLQKDNCIGEDKVEDSVISRSPGSKMICQSNFVNSVENLIIESHDRLIGQLETSSPICVDFDKINQFPEHESEILSYLDGDVHSQYADSPVEKSDMIKKRFGACSTESWLQLKRRKIEDIQKISTSYPSLEEHTYRIQRYSPGSILKNIEVDVNTVSLDSVGTRKSTDIDMSQDTDASQNSKNLNFTSGILQVKQYPVFVDDQQSQCLSLSSKSEDLELVAESMPVSEGFIADSQKDGDGVNFAAYEIDFAKLSRPRTALDRASILAEICRSASMNTPLSHFCSSENLQGTLNPFHSLPNGILEHLNLWTSLPLNIDVDKQLESHKSSVDGMEAVFERMPYSSCLPYSGTRYDWNSRIQHASPVGKLRERLSSHNGSSDKRSSSNLDLTCFPIEEDPCLSEDSKVVNEITDDVDEETVSLSDCDARQLLKDLTNTGANSFVSVSVQHDIMRKDDVTIASPNYNVYRTRDEVQLNPKSRCINYSKQTEKQTSSSGNMEEMENHVSPIRVDETKKAKGSINYSIRKSRLSRKTSSKKQMQNLAQDSKRNNIISSISSFIPLVQKAQAANIVGKKEVKVKALEAAEAAKRLEEKIVNERKKRKEALKLERAQLEVENLRKMELDKKRKEEERKKKDADIIAKKRLRDEEERKEKENKRMRLEARQRQREQEEKVRAEKADKQKQHTKEEKINGKESCSEFKKEQNQRIWIGGGVASKKTESKLIPAGIDRKQVGCGTSVDSSEAEKAIPSVHISPQSEDLTMQGKSYEISPYRSDNENEEDGDLQPTKKCTPWASVLSVALLAPLLQKMDPDEIFPANSFCSIDEVILPSKLKQKHVDA